MDFGLAPALNAADIASFIRDGFVRLDQAFSGQNAAEARQILWHAKGCDPNDRSTWTQPVIRLGQFGQTPFREAANTPTLQRAFDQLVGPGRWLPLNALGTFPVRFPSSNPPGDDGWHIDVSFGRDARLHGVAREHKQSRTCIADVVSILGRRAGRCTDAHSSGIAHRHRETTCARRRSRTDATRIGSEWVCRVGASRGSAVRR